MDGPTYTVTFRCVFRFLFHFEIIYKHYTLILICIFANRLIDDGRMIDKWAAG